jgi:pentatricopeptide repeat protein
MPRARVPNASFLASAESPVLPFLAPRVFTESSTSRRSHGHKGKVKRVQEEKRLRTGQTESITSTALRDDTACTGSQHNGQNAAGGLLQAARPQWRHLGSCITPSGIETRYTEIFAFARRFVRSYRTGEANPRKVISRTQTELPEASAADLAREALILKRRGIRTVRATPRKVASKTRVGPRKAPGVDTARKPSILNQRGPQLAALRSKALAVERGRLATCMAHELDHSVENFMKHGQYRSLRRRITNLERWDETTLDLRSHFTLMRAFAALDRSLYASLGRHTRKIILNHDPRCARWSASLFRDNAEHGLQKVWDNWRVLSVGTRESIYQRLLIYLLDRKPARAMQFIYVLARDRLENGRKTEAIADALGHLSKIHNEGVYGVKKGWGPDHETSKRSFVADFVHVFLQVLTAHRKICSQDLLYNLTTIADTKDLKKVWDHLMENRAFVGFDTVLHYANAFAKAGDISSALACLHELKAMNNTEGWDLISGRQRLRWTFALILRKSMSINQEYHETPLIVAAIVRLGIKLDILLYNVVMHNAMEARDYPTAFKVYNALESNGMKADKHTYSILLHGCAVQSNPAMFSQFAQHCADVAEEIKDPWLATDYLYYIYICHQNDSDKTQTAARLQQAYLRFFPARCLELLLRNRFRMAVVAASGTQSDVTKLDPPPVALYIMLQARIQEALSASTQQVEALYQGFKVLVQRDSEPALTRLAKDPIIWNAFLLAFCQKQQFASASQLIKDMTEGSPQPNIYSWNIFMQTFFKTGQVQAAERVFEILRSRGVDPDQFTYGVLLRGYAKSQHVDRIGETMQHVDAEAEMEPDLLRALAHVENRNQLMATLEKSRIHKEVNAREKARAEVQEDEKRWSAPQLKRDPLQVTTLTVASSGSDQDLDHIPGLLTMSEAEELNQAWVQSLDAASTPEPRSEGDPILDVAIGAEPTVDLDSKANVSPTVSPVVVSERQAVVKSGSTAKRGPRSTSSLKHTAKAQPVIDSKSANGESSFPRATSRRSLDPRTQYKKPQKQRGPPPPLSRAPSESPSKPSKSPSASLSSDSTPDSNEHKPQISQKLPEFRLRRVHASPESKIQRGDE